MKIKADTHILRMKSSDKKEVGLVRVRAAYRKCLVESIRQNKSRMKGESIGKLLHP